MKLLLHMCCGPCSVFPVSSLQEEGFELHGYFYNPNIHPIEEFNKRKENVEKLCNQINMPVSFSDEFMQENWERFEGEEAQRCRMCYSIRMDKVAKYANENGFEGFTTSLLVSPYQKHEVIVEQAEKAAKKYGVEFVYRDFRSGFRLGQQKAKDMELYRQKFCGCIVSYGESEFNKKSR